MRPAGTRSEGKIVPAAAASTAHTTSIYPNLNANMRPQAVIAERTSEPGTQNEAQKDWPLTKAIRERRGTRSDRFGPPDCSGLLSRPNRYAAHLAAERLPQETAAYMAAATGHWPHLPISRLQSNADGREIFSREMACLSRGSLRIVVA